MHSYLIMTDYYVYLHRKASSGEVFYVGKGKTRRAYDKFGRSKWWQRTVAKHGLIVEIKESGLQEWYAFEREAELIAYYGRSDLNQGALVNTTDGGEGASGSHQSVETRNRRSVSNVGKKRSDESKAIMKAAQQKFILDNPQVIELRRGAHRHEMKRVIRGDGVIYDSIHAAGSAMTAMGYSQTSYCKISSCCNGKRKTAFGFTWRFENATR